MITAANFHLATEAAWTMIDNGNVAATWSKLVAEHGLFYDSFSGSAYVVAGDVVYRKADHWGKVATCAWPLNWCASNMPGHRWLSAHMIIENGHGLPAKVEVVAMCRLSDFSKRKGACSTRRANELMKSMEA